MKKKAFIFFSFTSFLMAESSLFYDQNCSRYNQEKTVECSSTEKKTSSCKSKPIKNIVNKEQIINIYCNSSQCTQPVKTTDTNESSTFQNINQLIISISNLLWPIVSFSIVFLFRTDIRKLLERIRKGKFFGQELELDPKVDMLQETIKVAQTEVPEMPVTKEDHDNEEKNLDLDINEVFKASELSPELGLIRLASIIEKDIRIIAACTGDINSIDKKSSTLKLFDTLLERKRLPLHTGESLRIFWNLRNRIVHGEKQYTSHEVLRVLDLGLELLKTIRSIPHEINIVYYPEVDIYENAECTLKRQDVKGLILKTTSADGSKTFERIFPTTNSSYYKKDEQVSWEWNMSKQWKDSWYIHPDTQQIALAWNGAAEFIGRHIDDI